MPGSAPTPVNYSNVVDEVVTQQYVMGRFDATKKIRKFWKTLSEKGQIEYDASGKYVEWKARLGEHGSSVFGYRADLAPRTFVRRQFNATYTAPYAFIEGTAMLSERDLQFLNTPENVAKYQGTYLKELGDDFLKELNRKLLAENTTANTVMGIAATSTSDVPLYGLPTVFSHGSGTAQNYVRDSNTTSGNVANTDKEVLPNSTYCGVSTNPVTGVTGVDGQVIGSAAPTLTNFGCTSWNSTATGTWANNCLDVIDYHFAQQTFSDDSSDTIDLIMTNKALWLATKQKLRSVSSQQVVLVDTSGRSPNFGTYGNRIIPYDEAIITYDENMPSSTSGPVYFINSSGLRFKVFPQKYLARTTPNGIEGGAPAPVRISQAADIDVGAWKVVATMCAQLCVEPRKLGASYLFA